MDKGNRKKVGIIFNFDRTWLGGVYYLINIIKSLNSLEEAEKPEIILFYNKNLADFVDQIDYNHLTPVLWNFPSVYKGYLKSFLFRKNVFIDGMFDAYELDGLYPVNDQPTRSKKAQKNGIKVIAWFADLQHKFYPEFFKKKKLILRETKLKLLLKNSNELVVSSHDVKDHFDKFYYLRKKLNIEVLQFVSIIDDVAFDHIDDLKEKYNLPNAYYMVSNQFYKHKNHLIVFKALAEILSKGSSKVHIVMTGKMEHYNNPEFITQLRNEINNNNLESNLSMLDVIPREEQLCLMKHAKAVIQPSLFEGWSTVIEDAKSLQVPVIAANIKVHLEQLEDKGVYFDPHNEKQLATILSTFENNKRDGMLYEPYEKRVKKLAENFLNLFN